MRHANPLVWRGDLMVWGLTGILILTLEVLRIGHFVLSAGAFMIINERIA
jgi:hypothetical protein